MITILIFLLLAIINIPFALNKKHKYRGLAWFAIGFNIALLFAHLINILKH